MIESENEFLRKNNSLPSQSDGQKLAIFLATNAVVLRKAFLEARECVSLRCRELRRPQIGVGGLASCRSRRRERARLVGSQTRVV